MSSVLTIQSKRTGPADTIPTRTPGTPAGGGGAFVPSSFKITFNDAGDAILFNATDAILFQ